MTSYSKITVSQAGPTRCALSNNSTSAGELDKAIRALIDLLYITPLPVPHADRPGLLRSSAVRGEIHIQILGDESDD